MLAWRSYLEESVSYPADALTPAGGHCYAHLFENHRTGLPRNLYWSFTIDFADLIIDGERATPSLSVEWLVIPLRDWSDLVGIHRSERVRQDVAGPEASFYLFEHHAADEFELRVRGWRQARGHDSRNRDPIEFNVEASLVVDIVGIDDIPQREHHVGGAAWVTFDGVVVRPDNLTPRPESNNMIREVLRPYIDPGCLAEPTTAPNWWLPVVQ